MAIDVVEQIEEEVFERVQTDEMYFQREIESLQRRISQRESDDNYQRFYEEAGELSLNKFNHTSQKRYLLGKYFPKFRDDGKQPVSNMSDPKVGGLFLKIIEYSQGR